MVAPFNDHYPIAITIPAAMPTLAVAAKFSAHAAIFAITAILAAVPAHLTIAADSDTNVLCTGERRDSYGRYYNRCQDVSGECLHDVLLSMLVKI
jgi:hypothetical protein